MHSLQQRHLHCLRLKLLAVAGLTAVAGNGVAAAVWTAGITATGLHVQCKAVLVMLPAHDGHAPGPV